MHNAFVLRVRFFDGKVRSMHTKARENTPQKYGCLVEKADKHPVWMRMVWMFSAHTGCVLTLELFIRISPPFLTFFLLF